MLGRSTNCVSLPVRYVQHPDQIPLERDVPKRSPRSILSFLWQPPPHFPVPFPKPTRLPRQATSKPPSIRVLDVPLGSTRWSQHLQCSSTTQGKPRPAYTSSKREKRGISTGKHVGPSPSLQRAQVAEAVGVPAKPAAPVRCRRKPGGKPALVGRGGGGISLRRALGPTGCRRRRYSRVVWPE